MNGNSTVTSFSVAMTSRSRTANSFYASWLKHPRPGIEAPHRCHISSRIHVGVRMKVTGSIPRSMFRQQSRFPFPFGLMYALVRILQYLPPVNALKATAQRIIFRHRPLNLSRKGYAAVTCFQKLDPANGISQNVFLVSADGYIVRSNFA